MIRILKKCACGLRYDEVAWKCLAFVGYHEDEVEKLEMRNCACGSTLAVQIVEGRRQ